MNRGPGLGADFTNSISERTHRRSSVFYTLSCTICVQNALMVKIWKLWDATGSSSGNLDWHGTSQRLFAKKTRVNWWPLRARWRTLHCKIFAMIKACCVYSLYNYVILVLSFSDPKPCLGIQYYDNISHVIRFRWAIYSCILNVKIMGQRQHKQGNFQLRAIFHEDLYQSCSSTHAFG